MKIHAIVLGLGIVSLVYGVVQAGAGQAGKNGSSDVLKVFKNAKPSDYAGDKACEECHGTHVDAFRASVHAPFMNDPKLPLEMKGCEGCHGPGKAHCDNPDTQALDLPKMSANDASAVCLRCHGQTLGPSHWKRNEHARAGLSCTTCHQIHPDIDPDPIPGGMVRGRAQDPRTQVHFASKPDKQLLMKWDQVTLCGSCHPSEVGRFRMNYHHPVPEGRLLCSDCHSIHPSRTEKIRQTPFKSMCVTCHQDKAGPFVFEHDPVAGFSGDGCTECHAPHGSQNPAMLNAITRGLCAQCHSDKLIGHHNGQTCWSAGCHVAPHGSNTDANFLHP